MSSHSLIILRSNPVDPDPRVEKAARTFASAGYRVQVVGWDRTARLSTCQEKEGYTIRRLPIRAEYGKGLANFPALLRWQFGLLTWLIRHRKEYQIIHACDFDTVLPALILKQLGGKRVIYDIFDFYADHLRATPAPIKEIIRRVDWIVAARVDAVILADASRRQQLAPVQLKKLIYIYNTPEEVTVQPMVMPFRPSFLVSYVGLLQVERGLLILLDVLAKHPEWELWMAGFGGDQEMIMKKAACLPNVRFFGRTPYEKALALSGAADVLIATYDPSIPNHRFSSPNKIFEAMMLAKPIIVASGTNMDRLVAEAGCGIVVKYGDEVELEAALQRLAQNAELRRTMGENGRRTYETTYHWKIMASRLLHLYQEILPASGGT